MIIYVYFISMYKFFNSINRKKNIDFKKMKKEEIKILGSFGINNPYTN